MLILLKQYLQVLNIAEIPLSDKVRFILAYSVSLILNLVGSGALKTTIGIDGKPFYYSGSHKNLYLDHLLTHVLHYRQYYSQSKTIIDVGASFGTFPRIAQYFYPQTKVYCLEMADESYEILLKNVKNNINALAFKSAVGNKNRNVNYNYNPAYPENTALANPGKTGRSAQQITLDSFIKAHDIKGVSLIKIDTEGNEMQVLEGCRTIMTSLQAVIVETNFKLPNLDRVISYMKKYHFNLANLGDLNRINGSNIYSADLIFTKSP